MVVITVSEQIANKHPLLLRKYKNTRGQHEENKLIHLKASATVPPNIDQGFADRNDTGQLSDILAFLDTGLEASKTSSVSKGESA